MAQRPPILHIVIVIWGSVEIILFAGVIFGWASLVYVYKEEGYFSDLCSLAVNVSRSNENNSLLILSDRVWDKNITGLFEYERGLGVRNKTIGLNFDVQSCKEQDNQFSLIFTIATVLTGIMCFPNGFVYDHYGTRVCRSVAIVSFLLSMLLLIFASPARPWLLYPGAILLTYGGYLLLLTNLQLANLMPDYRSTIMTMYFGSNGCSSVIFLIFKFVHEHGVSVNTCFIIQACLFIIVIISTFITLPVHRIPWPLPEHYQMHLHISDICSKQNSEINLSEHEDEDDDQDAHSKNGLLARKEFCLTNDVLPDGVRMSFTSKVEIKQGGNNSEPRSEPVVSVALSSNGSHSTIPVISTKPESKHFYQYVPNVVQSSSVVTEGNPHIIIREESGCIDGSKSSNSPEIGLKYRSFKTDHRLDPLHIGSSEFRAAFNHASFEIRPRSKTMTVSMAPLSWYRRQKTSQHISRFPSRIQHNDDNDQITPLRTKSLSVNDVCAQIPSLSKTPLCRLTLSTVSDDAYSNDSLNTSCHESHLIMLHKADLNIGAYPRDALYKELEGDIEIIPAFSTVALSQLFLVLLFWISSHRLLSWFFVAEFNHWITSMADGDKAKVSYYTSVFSALQFLSILTAPLGGRLMDRKPKHRYEEKKLERVHSSVPTFILSCTMALLLSIGTALPILDIQYATFLLHTLHRSFLYGPNSAFVASAFPDEHFGKLFGISLTVSAIFGMLQYPLVLLIQGPLDNDPMWVNVGLITMMILTYAHPIFICFYLRKKRQLESRKNDDSLITDTCEPIPGRLQDEAEKEDLPNHAAGNNNDNIQVNCDSKNV